MVTRDEATAIARAEVDRLPGTIQCVLVEKATEEIDIGWVFFYTSARYIETGDFRDVPIGGGPLFVDRRDGSLHHCYSGEPWEDAIERYRATGRTLPKLGYSGGFSIVAGKVAFDRPLQQPVGSEQPELKRLREEADRYCRLVESAEEWEPQPFIAALAESLAGLISASWQITEMFGTGYLPDPPSREEWKARFAAIERAFGDAWDGYYWTVDPTLPLSESVPKPSYVPVADDLADIWRDLKPCQLALEEGLPAHNVASYWYSAFQIHWGRHATEALRAIQARLAEL
jgi:hypothetical protein